MIPLTLQVAEAARSEPFVTRLRLTQDNSSPYDPDDAVFDSADGGFVTFRLGRDYLTLATNMSTDLDGDVLFINPDRKTARRLIRAKSQHNSFLVTEQCDQNCVMCSQPPKKHHVDMFPYFLRAALLAPADMMIAITGGEPTVYKSDLFAFFAEVLSKRSDLRFHVLSNGQHFERNDSDQIKMFAHHVVWGIPLYSDSRQQHDHIVEKERAFETVLETFELLGRCGAQIELRTVVMKENVNRLPGLARFISRHILFVKIWAIMQLENIGFARKNWAKLFFDSSGDFGHLGAALDISAMSGLDARLYNFPLCTVPLRYRDRALVTISDWKRRYLSCCSSCGMQPLCTGFFEWYPEDSGFENVGPL